MRKLAKIIALVFIICAPILLGSLILYLHPSNALNLITGIYFVSSFVLLVWLCVKYRQSLMAKMGLWPVYQPVTPPPPPPIHKGNSTPKLIGFVGDSVTFGYDDDRNGTQLEKCWTKEVGDLLSCPTINLGISSASLLELDSWTPIAWCNSVHLIPQRIDILGFMIGINDCFRNYPLGKMGDMQQDTFYGGLYTFIKDLQKAFSAREGKRIFMIMYPNYDAKSDFKEYVKAMEDISHYFSIPVCDLSKRIGVSPFNDSDYIYWRKYDSNDFHSPHPTQITSHLMAESVSCFIKSHFNLQ